MVYGHSCVSYLFFCQIGYYSTVCFVKLEFSVFSNGTFKIILEIMLPVWFSVVLGLCVGDETELRSCDGWAD